MFDVQPQLLYSSGARGGGRQSKVLHEVYAVNPRSIMGFFHGILSRDSLTGFFHGIFFMGFFHGILSRDFSTEIFHGILSRDNVSVNYHTVVSDENVGIGAVLYQGLVLGEDYRVVNFHVWSYWMMVYGGGPSIGRASKDIYSRRAIGKELSAEVAVRHSATS